MRLFSRVFSGLRALVSRERVERELDEELLAYLDASVAQKIAAGLSRDEAVRQARLEFGSVEAAKDRVRDVGWESVVVSGWQDISYAVRGLLRAPAYGFTAIAMLGLGIGANAAIFSIVDAAMFKPLPYRDPGQLVVIRQVLRRGTAEESFQIGMTWNQVDRWRNEPQMFAGIATYTAHRVPVDGPTGRNQRFVSLVSTDMAGLLGVRPILGRGFVADDGESNAPVAMLSESYWSSAFRRDPGVLGRTIGLDGRQYTIVGVMPSALRWGVGGGDVVAWLPLDERSLRGPHGQVFVGAIARLRPGLTLESATAEMARAIERVEGGVPADRRYAADLMPLDARTMYDAMNKTRRALTALLAAIGFVFLIGCANVANLVLARVLDRQREIAVRAALGASRPRLFRQFFTEGIVVVVTGAFCAAVLAIWTVQAVPQLVPDQLQLFDANAPIIDARTSIFGLAAMVVAVIVCCLIPALRVVARDMTGLLEAGLRIAGPPRSVRRLRATLQAGQVALTLVLLTGAGLLTTSFVRMIDTQAGYDVDRLVTGTITLPRQGHASPENSGAFFESVLSRVNAVPGLRATYGPAPANSRSGRFVPFGRDLEHASGGALSIYFVAPDYFAITGIPMKSGRMFDSREASAGAPVGVIDERAAALYWPGQSAIGQRFRYSPYDPWVTVIGIAGHIKTHWFAESNGTIQVWVPTRLSRFTPVQRPILIRTDRDLAWTLVVIGSTIKAVDRDAEFEDGSPVSDLYEDVLKEPRFFLTLMTLFAGLALLTASVGLYGLVNYGVAQRAREIGVRIALGASARSIVHLVMRDALIPVALGIVFGIGASWWLSRALSSLLYEVTPHDPSTFVLVTTLMVLVVGVAAYLPTRVATRIDPILTLRAE